MNPDIIVLKASKGEFVVILDKEDYQKKTMEHLINNGTYKKPNKNPLKKIYKIVDLAIKSSISIGSFSHKLIESSPITPRIYGLPKIHKEGAPLKPIVNTIGGPTYLLAKYLAMTLKPLVGRTESFVKVSSSFVKELEDLIFERGDNLVNFDAFSCTLASPLRMPLVSSFALLIPTRPN